MLVTPANLGKGEPDNSLLGPAHVLPITSGRVRTPQGRRWAVLSPDRPEAPGKGRETVNEAETRKTIWTYRCPPQLQASPSRPGDHQRAEGGSLPRPPGPPNPPDSTRPAWGHSCTAIVSGHSFEVNASGSMCRCEAREQETQPV